MAGEEGWVHIVTSRAHVPVCPVPNFLPSVPLSPSSVSSMMPNVINKFLDSTLHKVLPGLVSAWSKPPTLVHRSTETWAGWRARFISGADTD